MGEPSAPGPPSLGEAGSWLGLQVDEAGGAGIGEAHALFADAASGEPTWLIVKQGRFKKGSLVSIPLRDCAAGGGRIWAAHPRETIRSSPVVDPTRPLLREHELTICAHYGIGEGAGRAAEVVGRVEGSITSRPAR